MSDGFTPCGQLLRSGVYALVYKKDVVYVGKAKVLLARLMQHKNNYTNRRKRPAASIPFDDFWVRPCHTVDLDRLEAEMIAKYQPKYNRLLKKANAPITINISGVELALTPKPPKEGMMRRI